MRVDDPVFESVETFTPEAFLRYCETSVPPESVYRYELLNGRIVMTPAPGWPHGEIEARLVSILSAFVNERDLGRVFGSSQGFQLPSHDAVLLPDATFVSKQRWAEGTVEFGKTPILSPDLVVEILSKSTSSYDRGEKRSIYERNRVREYWLVDPRKEAVTVFVLEKDHFVARLVAEESADVTSAVLAGLSIPIAEIFPSR